MVVHRGLFQQLEPNDAADEGRMLSFVVPLTGARVDVQWPVKGMGEDEQLVCELSCVAEALESLIDADAESYAVAEAALQRGLDRLIAQIELLEGAAEGKWYDVVSRYRRRVRLSALREAGYRLSEVWRQLTNAREAWEQGWGTVPQDISARWSAPELLRREEGRRYRTPVQTPQLQPQATAEPDPTRQTSWRRMPGRVERVVSEGTPVPKCEARLVRLPMRPAGSFGESRTVLEVGDGGMGAPVELSMEPLPAGTRAKLVGFGTTVDRKQGETALALVEELKVMQGYQAMHLLLTCGLDAAHFDTSDEQMIALMAYPDLDVLSRVSVELKATGEPGDKVAVTAWVLVQVLAEEAAAQLGAQVN